MLRIKKNIIKAVIERLESGTKHLHSVKLPDFSTPTGAYLRTPPTLLVLF